jgi:cytochrome c oxidase subunit 1
MNTDPHTILLLPDQPTATPPKRSYLNNEHGILSWLLRVEPCYQPQQCSVG